MLGLQGQARAEGSPGQLSSLQPYTSLLGTHPAPPRANEKARLAQAQQGGSRKLGDRGH